MTRDTALNYEAWCEELPSDFPNRDYILAGIKDGFHIVDDIDLQCDQVEMDNYRSATCTENFAKVEHQIKDEIVNGHYKIIDHKPTIVSALGAIPKKGSNKVRLIHDCSRPVGKAVNDYATNNKFKYQTLQNAVDLIKPGYYMAKLDLANAYRCVKIHPTNHDVTGLKWKFSGDDTETFLVDCRLPFGARKSPEIFNLLTQTVRRILARRGIHGIVVYLDDWIIVSPTYKECLETINILLQLLRKLGFQINYNKIEGPCQQLVFLGILLDSIAMTLFIPPGKISELLHTLTQLNSAQKTTKRKLQSLAGKLNWASQCVYGGRMFMRSILNKINALCLPWHRTRITQDVRQDIMWWITFLKDFNGTVPMVDSRPAAPVCIDACNLAAGAHFMGDCIYTRWQDVLPRPADVHINTKEILALEPAAMWWAPAWANQKIYVHTDNQVAACAINKGTSKDPVAMTALRRIYWLSVQFNFRLRAVYYPGDRNRIADAVSRLHEPGGWNRLQFWLNYGSVT